MPLSLRTRTTLLVLLAVLVNALAGYLVHAHLIYPRFLELERAEARANLGRVSDALKREVHHLNLLVPDWANWDDVWHYVQDHNTRFEEVNLMVTSYQMTHIDLLYFYDLQGRRVWGKLLDGEELVEWDGLPPQDPRHPLITLEKKEVVGLWNTTDLGVLLVASQPIMKSDGMGPEQGKLIMARRLDEALLATLRNQVNIPFQFWTVADPALPPEVREQLPFLKAGQERIVASNDALQAFALLPDIQGQPLLILRADTSRKISAMGEATLFSGVGSVFVTGLVILLVLLAALGRMVLAPVIRIQEHLLALGRRGDLTARLGMMRKDELGILGREVDAMTARLETSQQRLSELSYLSGMSTLAGGVLHNVRNAVVPLTVGVEVMQKQLPALPFAHMCQALDEIRDPAVASSRKEDLLLFLELGLQRVRETLTGLEERLGEMGRQILAVEEILLTQEGLVTPGQPMEYFLVRDLVQHTLRLLSQETAAMVTLESTLQETLNMPRVILIQILVNLLDNAARSIHEAGVTPGRIVIRATREEEEGNAFLHLAVRDNGAGLPREGRERLFERGFSTKKAKPGAGLGLHWSANAVIAQGGRIEARDNDDGAGAVFHVLLPLPPG